MAGRWNLDMLIPEVGENGLDLQIYILWPAQIAIYRGIQSSIGEPHALCR